MWTTMPGDSGRVGEGARGPDLQTCGGNRSLPNLDVIGKNSSGDGKPATLLRTVTDRPGHDRRYALTSAKLTRETGWAPRMEFEHGLAATIQWYRDNQEWVQRVKSGEYQKFYALNDEGR